MSRIFCKITIMCLCILLLSSCSYKGTVGPNTKSDDNSSLIVGDGNDKVKSSNSNKLLIWGYDPAWIKLKSEMKKKFPNLELKFMEQNVDITNDFLDKAAAGNVPDVVVLKAEYRSIGKIHYMDVFDDLLKPPYNAKEIMGKFSKTQLCFALSPDGKKLNAIPMAQYPSVAYYRKDILEKYGFPGDPDELGKYMEDPDNWLNMAKELKKHDHWIAQWLSEPSDIYFKNIGFYDNNFNYIRKGPEIGRILYAARVMRQFELASNIGVWEPSGQEAISSGKLCMIYLGSWGEKKLKEWAPKSKGLWRVTKLPFGANAFDGFHVLGIPKDSKNKEAAWEFIKMVINNENKDFKEAYDKKNDYLGGQYSERLYTELRKKLPEVYFTPLEIKFDGLWQTELQNYYGFNYEQLNDSEAVKFIESRFDETFKRELNILKNYVESQK